MYSKSVVPASASCNLLFISYSVFFISKILYSVFLTGPFLWFLCHFFMLLSILVSISLNSLSDKLLASIYISLSLKISPVVSLRACFFVFPFGCLFVCFLHIRKICYDCQSWWGWLSVLGVQWGPVVQSPRSPELGAAGMSLVWVMCALLL